MTFLSPENIAKKNIDVILVAAGISQRYGGKSSPKVYQKLAGLSVLEHSIHNLLKHPSIHPSRLQVVINADHESIYKNLTHLPDGLRPYCFGGNSRAQSVQIGLNALDDGDETGAVLIHDAARPNITLDLLHRLINGLVDAESVIPTMPISDALKENDTYLSPVQRQNYCISQTPQAFHISALQEVYQQINAQEPFQNDDEASLFHQLKRPIASVAGEAQNIKITYPEDMQYLRRIMSHTVYGTGFDLHRFETKAPNPENTIKIAGHPVKHPCKLIGHSDGDVVLHALCDAIYGCIAKGDIGDHFPPSDPKWKGQDSRFFLEHALDLLTHAQGILRHIDATIIADQPKIFPIRNELTKTLCQLCELPKECVNLKATTTEGLGFIQAKDAIAAQVMISVDLPKVD